MCAGTRSDKAGQSHGPSRRLGDGIACLVVPDIAPKTTLSEHFEYGWVDLAIDSWSAHGVEKHVVGSGEPTRGDSHPSPPPSPPPSPSPAPTDASARTLGTGEKVERQLEVQGTLNGVCTSAIPDLGSSFNIISEGFALSSGFHIEKQRRPKFYTLPNGVRRRFSGVANLAWTFSGESQTYYRVFHVLKGCIHPVILGENFLRMTKTFTKYAHRVKTVFVPMKTPLRRLLYIDDDEDDTPRMAQTLLGTLNGRYVSGLADTCSDLPIVKRSVALQLGLPISEGPGCTTKVQFVDGSISRTSGVIKGVTWAFGLGRGVEGSHHIDFHVMDDIPCSVILSKWLLLDNNFFLEYEDLFPESPGVYHSAFLMKRIEDSVWTSLDSLDGEAECQSGWEEDCMSSSEQVMTTGESLSGGAWQAAMDRRLGYGFRHAFAKMVKERGLFG